MATSVEGERWAEDSTTRARASTDPSPERISRPPSRELAKSTTRDSNFDKKGSITSRRASITTIVKPRRRQSFLTEENSKDYPSSPPSAQKHLVKSVSSSILSFITVDESSDDEENAGGLLVDLHRRLSSQIPPDKRKSVKAKKRNDGDDALREVKEQAGLGMASAVEAICYDMLYSRIMQDVTIFWKSILHQDWIEDCNPFLSWAHTVVKYKRRAICLNAEVDAWYFRHQILHARPTDSEDAQVRHGRLQQFWADFHESSWKMEPRALRPPFKDDLRRRVYRDNMNELPRDLGKAQIKGRASAALAPKGLSSSTSSLHDLNWKNRSMRSHVSAGKWDWGHGSGLGRCSSSPSQPAKRKHAHWSTSLFDLDLEELEEYYDPLPEEEGGENKCIDDASRPASRPISPDIADNTFLTETTPRPTSSQVASFRPSTQESSCNTNQPSMGKKAASLPNLKKLTAAFGPEAIRPSSTQSNSNFKGNIVDSKFLPPVMGKFSVPWQYASPDPILKCVDSPTKRYLRACQKDKNIPRPLPFITGHSLKFNAMGQSLSDKDLEAVTVTLEDVGIEEVDLTGNTQLTEHSLLKFAQALSKPPAASSLKKLILKRMCAGQKVLNTVVKALGDPDGIGNLRTLDLTDVSMGMRCHLPFASAVRDHKRLKSLTLANTGVGSGMDVLRFVHDLLSSESMEILDLGWNCFTADVLSHLGERHVQMQKLKRLGLSNCAAAPRPGTATTIVYFLEHLARDSKLRSLDISLNRVDFRAALVLEDALMHVKNLTELNISNNPLGVLGMRSLLRLLCQDSAGLISFDCNNCSNGSHSDSYEGLQVFRKTTPGGRYNLELERPYHRSLLRMLYKTSEYFGMEPGASFSNVTYSSPPWVHAVKDRYNVWVVPCAGKLHATFSIDEAVMPMLEEGLKENVESYDFEVYMKRYIDTMRTTPGFRKVIPLFAQWRRIDGHNTQQMVMLDALAKDFLVSYPQMVQLCRSRSVVCDVISRLFGSIQGGMAERYMSMTLVRSFADAVKMLNKVKPLLIFNLGNPTGRYCLCLDNHAEYAVAEKLLLLDRWEQGVNIRLGRPDVSQKGNYSVLRNEKYCHRPLPDLVTCMSEWILPEHDVLEFDFASGRRPPRNAQPLDEISFSNIMVTLENSDCSYGDKLTALRMASHAIYLTAIQLRSLMGNFDDMDALVEMIVLFFSRVIDMYNEKVFRVRIEDQFLMEQLRRRLGYIAMFPYIQPEQTRFHLEFGVYETRIVANMLMLLSKAENVSNLRDPIYIKEDGKRDPLLQGIYRSWENLDKLPKGGTFDISYVNAPETRNFAVRKQLFETNGHWTLTAEEDEVMWWASLTEAPEDVLEYLEFLISKYENPRNAFKEIIKHCGTDAMSLREFELAYRTMGCEKFKGHDEMHRISAVFRWLDVSGEGQVCEDEFMMLDLLFKEIQQSITEFVEYCERAFGDDLGNTWNVMDEDDSGEIDEQEWRDACAKIRYRGPIAPIFNYLDQDDEGHISWDEFQALTKFQKAKNKISEEAENQLDGDLS